MPVSYEWDRETVDLENGDVLDHDHRDKLSEYGYPLDPTNQVLVLVRDDPDGLRQWAYVLDGKLPEFFSVPEGDGEYYETNARVPKRFHDELARSALQ